MYAFEWVSRLSFNAGTLTYTPTGAAHAIAAPTYEGSSASRIAAVKDVIDAAALRPDRMSEIVTQLSQPTAYFAMLLNLQPGRHRYTFELMSTVFKLSTFASMQFKHHFRVLRPADRSPLVQPIINTPRHGSYPAGHATQCAFVATVLTAVVGTHFQDSNGQDDFPVQIGLLADRIAHNRVVAGLHFLEDNVKGRALGIALAGYFLNLVTVNGTALKWLFAGAKSEW